VTQILTGGATNIEADIFGPDINVLSRLSKETLDKLRQVPGLEAVDIAIQDATPELQWKVDRDKALQLGVSFSDIATALNTATNGDLSSYYQEGGFQYPIYVQLPESKRKSVDELLNLPIGSASGSGASDSASTRDVRLRQVATPIISVGPNEVDRLDRQRYIAVTGRASDRSESEVQADVAKAMATITMPQGYHWDFGINQKRRDEEFSGLGLAIFMAIALIYMLLASQFESFVHPLTVLASVPLSAVGVILALFLTGRAFGLTAFIGLLMLIGIVVKNGILLVDYTTQLRNRGMDRDTAILTASPTRLRPILMTASAAILGMLPLALAIGKGSETQAPLATAVIGGLFTSTVLTLFIVPIVYTMFDDLQNLVTGRKGDETSATTDAAEGSASHEH
jgi:HAE1 family hydrophobic/amphiphilic exporter-1